MQEIADQCCTHTDVSPPIPLSLKKAINYSLKKKKLKGSKSQVRYKNKTLILEKLRILYNLVALLESIQNYLEVTQKKAKHLYAQKYFTAILIRGKTLDTT